MNVCFLLWSRRIQFRIWTSLLPTTVGVKHQLILDQRCLLLVCYWIKVTLSLVGFDQSPLLSHTSARDFQSVLHLCGLYIYYISWGLCYVNLNIAHCHSCGVKHQRLVMSLHVWMRHGDRRCTSSENTSASAWDDQSGRAMLRGLQRIMTGHEQTWLLPRNPQFASTVTPKPPLSFPKADRGVFRDLNLTS